MSTTGDMVIDLNFVPEWARRPADQNPYVRFEGRRAPRSEPGGRPSDRRARDAKPGARDPARGRFRGALPRRGRPVEGDRSAPLPARAPVPVKVTFIPERRGLQPLAAQLARSGRAYPLFEVAALFLSKPEFYAVKQELMADGPASESLRLYQCAECKMVFLDRSLATAHVLGRHAESYYVREETQVDPPKGTFQCVARCTLSGELLGPPNYHGYAERVLDVHRTRFPAMPIEDYRKRIVNETDPALIEQWKTQSCRQVVYRLAKAAEADSLQFARRQDMESHFLEHYAPGLIREGARFITPGVACRALEDSRIQQAIEEAWARENRFPLNLAIAIQPAFRHLGLFFFKTAGRATFVSAIMPHAMNPAQATEAVRSILECLSRNPGLRRRDLAEALYPRAAPDAPEVAALIHALRWLVDRGHVIEFYNGTLAIPGRRAEAPKEPAGSPAPSRGAAAGG